MPPPAKEYCVRLTKFKMEWITDGKIIVMIGARGRGKSTIVLDYLFHNQDIPFVCCISPTDIYNSTFTPHIPSRFIFAKYTPELVANFVKRQRHMKSKKTQAVMGIGEAAYANADCRGLLLMDDCLAESKGWNTDASLKWIFLNGRHADISFVLTMQYQMGIPPEYRSNIDWVFICKENKKVERDKLWKYYAGIFPTIAMFEQIFMSCTTDKKCMVINQLAESSRLEDQVYWFKAHVRTNFRVCYDHFWENNEYYLNKRLEVTDTKPNTESTKAVDDYYKYTGGRNKARYNLDMSEEEGYPDDYEYMRQSEMDGGTNYGETMPSIAGRPGNY
jgi:hypothetical protein